MASLSSQINDLARKLEKRVGKVITKRDMVALGNMATTLVVSRTRRGRGVREGSPNEFKLKPLSEQYVDFRKRNKAILGQGARPKKSNLTLTGQLLASIKPQKPKKEGKKIVVTIKPDPDKRSDTTATNTEVGLWVSKVRPFLNLSKREKGRLLSLLRKRIKSRT